MSSVSIQEVFGVNHSTCGCISSVFRGGGEL